MFKRHRKPDRWWNAVIEITIPFDTKQEALDAYAEDSFLDGIFDLVGPNTTISGRVEEVEDGEPV